MKLCMRLSMSMCLRNKFVCCAPFHKYYQGRGSWFSFLSLYLRKKFRGWLLHFLGRVVLQGRDQWKSQGSWEKPFCVSGVSTWSEPDAVRLSQLGLWRGWNKQFFFLTDSCSLSSLISHHSDRLQRGMLIASQAAAGRAMLTTPRAAAPTAGAATNPAMSQHFSVS